jgi:hypothetical protein
VRSLDFEHFGLLGVWCRITMIYFCITLICRTTDDQLQVFFNGFPVAETGTKNRFESCFAELLQVSVIFANLTM